MLLSPRDVIGECVELLVKDHFYIPAHQTIYAELIEMWRNNEPIDLLTITQILTDKKLLDKVGGASFVTSLHGFVPTAANVDYYIGILRDKYILRQIIVFGTESVRRAYEAQDEAVEVLGEVERRALAIRPDDHHLVSVSMKDAVMDSVEEIEKTFDRKGAISGLSTGFIELDRITSGLQPEMIVLAARPSMGKTALAMNIAEHVALNEKLAVGVFSLEMTRRQLVHRLLCSRARVNLQKVRDGFLAERDFPSLTAAAAKLAESKIFIDDEMLKIDAVRSRARRMKHQHDIRLLIIDYLQLVHASGFRPNERQQELSHVSSVVKALVKELNIPIIAIAQLNRQPEARAGGRPRMSDLRESGSLEQDADLIALLYRPEVYEEDEEARMERAGEAELLIAKQRSGPVGEIPLTFLKEFTRFEDRARNLPQEGY